MAINSNTSTPTPPKSGVVKVKDPNNYLSEMFDTAMDPAVPSFADFLKNYRGIDLNMFPQEAQQILALIMETTVYSQYCAMLKQAGNATKAGAGMEEQMLTWVENSPVAEVQTAIDSMEEQVQKLRDALSAKVATAGA